MQAALINRHQRRGYWRNSSRTVAPRPEESFDRSRTNPSWLNNTGGHTGKQ